MKDKFEEIFFSVEDKTMTVHCFNDHFEMPIIISSGNKRVMYKLSTWEVKQLKKFLNEQLKDFQP
jgi:hypothetical protein